MSRRKYLPCINLARAVEDTVFRAGLSAYSMKDKDPDEAARLMKQADKLEAIYLSERGEHYYETIRRHA